MQNWIDPLRYRDDVQTLRDVEYILRTGRVGDLVHDSWPNKIRDIADQFDPQRTVKTQFGRQEQ